MTLEQHQQQQQNQRPSCARLEIQDPDDGQKRESGNIGTGFELEGEMNSHPYYPYYPSHPSNLFPRSQVSLSLVVKILR